MILLCRTMRKRRICDVACLKSLAADDLRHKIVPGCLETVSGLGREGAFCGRFVGQSVPLHALDYCAHSLPRSSTRARQACSITTGHRVSSPHQLRSQPPPHTPYPEFCSRKRPPSLGGCDASWHQCQPLLHIWVGFVHVRLYETGRNDGWPRAGRAMSAMSVFKA